ncbi:hypothetical protein RxyAA322_13610 [Rubrobacter xylanophilus]|uniref:Uncharacterized protein n=1 Tax=Rubrobacter xylanophilus TaxID=49319 RepID=A0A510HM41_9ACTN|nr:hypothetical protein [Rubrobacter xylanophilus]BBL79507.1 hypothetical protein RxyAA322_13610 [Rubrobacter xylanophilus]
MEPEPDYTGTGADRGEERTAAPPQEGAAVLSWAAVVRKPDYLRPEISVETKLKCSVDHVKLRIEDRRSGTRSILAAGDSGP